MSRSRLAASDGFTLIELLVVILIIGILAAIALPVFLGQKDKAQDASAKTAVSTAAKAVEAWNTDHDSSYAGVTAADLKAIESSLVGAPGLTVTSTKNSYTVTVDSIGAGGTFSIARAADGSVVHDCTNPGKGTCGNTPDAQGNRW